MKNTIISCILIFKTIHIKNLYKNILVAAAATKSLQSCPTLCDPRDGSPPGSSVHGIFQAGVLEWGAISFSILVAVMAKWYILKYIFFFPAVLFFFSLIFFPFIFISWRLITLQYCSGFCHTLFCFQMSIF